MKHRTSIAFLVVVAAWGSSYLFIRLAVQSFTPFGLVATRFGAAAVLCAVLARLRGERFPDASVAARYAVVGLLMMSGSNALTAYAQATVSSALAGIMHSLSSVWLAALGAAGAFGRDAPRSPAAAWPGIVLGVVGVGVLVWPEEGQVRAETLGVAALLLATALFAAASVLQRRTQARVMREAPAAGGGLFATLAVQMAGGASVAVVVSAVEGPLRAPLTPAATVAVVVLTLFASIGGFAAYAVVLRDWPPARAGSFAVINPVVATVLGVTVLGETLTSRRVVGALITLAAVGWVQWVHVRPVGGRVHRVAPEET